MRFETGSGRLGLTLEIARAGDDLSALLYGGERPHIGCAAVALPRPSLRDPAERSCTSSVFCLSGHKDEALCRPCAEALCLASGAVCVCQGGFHSDGMAPDEVEKVLAAARELTALACDALRRAACRKTS